MANKHIDLQDFFRDPEKISFQLSPDGEHIAFLAPFNGRLNVHVQHRDGGEVRVLSTQSTRNIAGLTWANSSLVLYVRDIGGDENWQLFVSDIHDGSERCLTPFPGVRSQVVDVLEDVEEEILLSMNQRDPTCFDVYRCTLSSGALECICENPGSLSNWRTDHDGVVRCASHTDGVNSSIYYRDSADDEWRELLRSNFKESATALGFSYDNRQLYVINTIGRNTAAIQLLDPATARIGEVLFANENYDMDFLMMSDHRKCVLGAGYWADKAEYIVTDALAQKRFATVRSLLPDQNISFSSTSRDERWWIVVASDPRQPASYYLYDDEKATIRHLADARPWLHSEELSPVEPVRYTSRDGLLIHGYLCIPKGAVAKNMPVVINPHGGPWARDYWQFDPTVQFLASRGFAVMQMNFRGSTGYGRQFWQASFKQWGRTMQNDISDAVQWLVAEGIADPARVAILGGSYGGYAVLAGLAFTPELYCCGVDIVGVSNLFTFRASVPEYWKPANDMLDEMIGDPIADKDLLREVSPYFHADNISVPLLVFQGARDPRVNIAESDQIVGALRAKGVEVEYVVKDDEGHGFVNQENRLEMYHTMERFLVQHLKPSDA